MKTEVLWDVMLCWWTSSCHDFEGS